LHFNLVDFRQKCAKNGFDSMIMIGKVLFLIH